MVPNAELYHMIGIDKKVICLLMNSLSQKGCIIESFLSMIV